MATQSNPVSSPQSPSLPGLEVVGRGIYLQPRQPYELKDVLFKRDNHWTYLSGETGHSYSLPGGYEINDSPPMPARQALNQTVIVESWERLDKQLSVDTSVTASSKLFSVDATASQARQLQSNEEAYYALRSSFVPLWSVYLPDLSAFPKPAFKLDIPAPFKHANRRAYDAFFERYGTHFVKRAWVGGKAVLAFTVTKSSQLSKEDIKAGITASFGGAGSGSASTALSEKREKLRSNSECTVMGKGGDEPALASLSSLDEASYNAWLTTVKQNPQVIELEVAGIWTLIDDPKKAAALQEAYVAATAFPPISALFSLGPTLYFLRGNQCFTYDSAQRSSEKPKHIKEFWPELGDTLFERPDAAISGYRMTGPNGENLSHKLYLFKRDQFTRLDMKTGKLDKGYPKRIAEGWPGVSFDRIDAALNTGPDAIYFFRGGQYIRFNFLTNRADGGYPEPIAKRWTGVIFERIDAAFYWGNEKVYFFKDDQYIRYDMAVYQSDPGYPKFIIGSYVEDWKFFE